MTAVEMKQTTVSFALIYSNFFYENEGEIDVFNEQKVPDSELGALMDQVQSNFTQYSNTWKCQAIKKCWTGTMTLYMSSE